MLRPNSRILICAAAILAAGAQAAQDGILLQHDNSAPPIEAPPGEAFLERFKVSFDQGLDEVYADRLHPFSIMNWKMEMANRPYDEFRERTASAARNGFVKSVAHGMREAAVDLPVLLWLQERQGLLADFLRNSLDSVAEEAVAPTDVSYRPVERSWWKRVSGNDNVSFGIRPFRADPYAFVSLGIKDGDRTLLLANLRYHYRPLVEHLIEAAFSVPLAHGFAIDLGASYKFGQHGNEERLVVKFFKEFKSGGILHVSMEAREHPAFFAGVALPW